MPIPHMSDASSMNGRPSLRRFAHVYFVACVCAALAWSPFAAAAGDAPEAAQKPDAAVGQFAYDQFIVIPLRVHVLTATDLPEVDCKLSDEDVRRIIAKVNTVVWHKAGIHFALESIRREPAARQDDFRRLRDLVGGLPPMDLYPILRPDVDARPAEDAPPADGAPADAKAAGAAAATGAEDGAAAAKGKPSDGDPDKFEGLRVYYVHDLASNGVYFGADFAFVKETSSLRPVEGGIDEPIPRVTSHELGHALGLPHRQNWTNLMQSGTTGTLLNAAEAATARERAEQLAGTASVATLRERAAAFERDGERERAAELWTLLGEIPGDGAADAGAERDRLRMPK